MRQIHKIAGLRTAVLCAVGKGQSTPGGYSTQDELTGEQGTCRADRSLSKVNVDTYLHIRDSIFWVAVKLHCAQTGENRN